MSGYCVCCHRPVEVTEENRLERHSLDGDRCPGTAQRLDYRGVHHPIPADIEDRKALKDSL
jgi:chloramphenicol 3-O-phosphotransferase